MSEEAATAKRPRDRSPSFPFITLKSAIERLKEFERKFGRNPPPANRTYLAWGYKGDTSQSQQTLAALKSFGLVNYEGSGPARLVAISEDGRNYLRAQQDTIKHDIARRLALKPVWIAKMWESWGKDRHPDEVCLDQLVLEHKFNEKAAPRFLMVYDETIAFAQLSDSDKTSSEEGDGEAGEDQLPHVSVGDKIHCTVHGSNVFDPPATVLGISEDGLWVFTDQSDSGSPIKNVTVVELASNNTLNDPPPPSIPDGLRAAAVSGKAGHTPLAGTLEDKAHLDEGVAILWWPETLSQESVEELEYWINGIIKRAKRRAGIVQKNASKDDSR